MIGVETAHVTSSITRARVGKKKENLDLYQSDYSSFSLGMDYWTLSRDLEY